MTTGFIRKKQDSKELILLFNGWGMDQTVFQPWGEPPVDVLEVHDYRDLDSRENLIRDLSAYRSIIVLAWSMGVWAYTALSHSLAIQVERAIAINGTPNPIHEHLGIPPRVFDATLEKMDQENLGRFYRRMCLDQSAFEKFQQHKPARPLAEQIQELSAVQEQYQRGGEIFFHPFHQALISRSDRIFPVANQHSFWRGRADILETEGGHFCFDQWQNWEDFLEFCFHV